MFKISDSGQMTKKVDDVRIQTSRKYQQGEILYLKKKAFEPNKRIGPT